MDQIDPNTLAILQEMMEDGTLAEAFYPHENQQKVLDQQMMLAQQLAQPGAQRSSPMGALLGGLSNAIGKVGGAAMQSKAMAGQEALGDRMQKGGVHTIEELLKAHKAAPPASAYPDLGMPVLME
jgi:hypothetical protein